MGPQMIFRYEPAHSKGSKPLEEAERQIPSKKNLATIPKSFASPKGAQPLPFDSITAI